MKNVIEIESLHKSYRRRGGTTVAVDGLDLAVPEGGVYGFLGPNGSGKTTTIRCILGLARPTKGELRLLGRPVPGGLRDSVQRIGAIVETPALFPTMTARENLRLLASVDRIAPRTVDEAIEAAADYLYNADMPLVYGMSNTTCEAQKECVELADQLCGLLDSHTSL